MFKKIVAGLMLSVMLVTMSGCGKPKTIEGTYYPTKGLITMNEKDPNIQYEISVGNVIWSVILCETIVAPVYFLGFSMFDPIKKIEKPVETKKSL